jgi:hypothetical protein
MPPGAGHFGTERHGTLSGQFLLECVFLAGVVFKKLNDLFNFDHALRFNAEIIKINVLRIDRTLRPHLNAIKVFHLMRLLARWLILSLIKLSISASGHPWCL